MSSIAGALMIAVYTACTFVSFLFFPSHFRVTENYLSDLGSSVANPHGAIVYNVGIILAGAALFPFFVGLGVWKSRLLVATQALGFVEGIALIMIGVHPEASGDAHVVWSNVQFFLNLLVLAFGTAALLKDHRFIRAIGFYAVVAIALQVAALVLIVLGHSSPLVEWLTVLTTMLFVGLLSLNMSKVFGVRRSAPE